MRTCLSEIFIIYSGVIVVILGTAKLFFLGKSINKTLLARAVFLILVCCDLFAMFKYDAGIVQLVIRGLRNQIKGVVPTESATPISPIARSTQTTLKKKIENLDQYDF